MPVQKPAEPQRQPEPKRPRPWVWISAVIILALALVASVLTSGFGMTGGFVSLNPNSAAGTAITFINTNILTSGAKAELAEVQEVSGLYEINFTVSGQKYSAYVSRDGKLLFPQFIDISATKTQPGQNDEGGFNPPKTDKPTVQMFVMSFCPYGKQAEQGMWPAMAVLGKDVNFEPHFIVSVSGNVTNSLHGPNEAQEDMRQAVIWKYWPEKFWKYVNYVNANATLNTIGNVWKDAAKAAGLDSGQIESKVATEGLSLMNTESMLSQSLGVSSSPTILINGVSYSGDRTAEAFKTAICSAFNSPPAGCAQALSNEAGAASGDCATP